ncbi:hypothetical protein [Pedobacter sp. B4-66]|uniref:hypothetical protein n=1 Tax=Pedobacter sp. B4-66 TaxID=2817280 RepID=UPI001BDA8ADB|nr:hypothetical protein [Pedobacter sp. B4-66]
MTIEELKESIAKQKGYDDWANVRNFGWRSVEDLMMIVASKWTLYNAKAFKIWCDNQVIAGRTTHKLFLDWQESIK